MAHKVYLCASEMFSYGFINLYAPRNSQVKIFYLLIKYRQNNVFNEARIKRFCSHFVNFFVHQII